MGVPAGDPIISLTLGDIAGVWNKPEVPAFATLFETRIELAFLYKLVKGHPQEKKPLKM